MRVADNASSGCIDCVGCAVDRTYGQAAREVGYVGPDVAEICGRIRRLVPLPEFHLQLNVAFVGIAARLLAFILMSREAGNDQGGQDAKDYQRGHYLHEREGSCLVQRSRSYVLNQAHLSAFATHLIVLTM